MVSKGVFGVCQFNDVITICHGNKTWVSEHKIGYKSAKFLYQYEDFMGGTI